MKGTVIKTYIDRYTGLQCSAGDTVEYATDRAKFLSEKGYIKLSEVEKAEPIAPVEAVEKKAEPAKPKKAPAKPKKKESR